MDTFYGSIDSKTPVFLTYEGKGTIYLLSLIENKDESFSFVMADTVDIGNGSQLYQPAYFYLDLTNKNGNNINVTFNNKLNSLSKDLTPTVVGDTFLLSSSSYALWDAYSLLSGIPYSINVNFPLKSNDASRDGGTINIVTIAPIQWYYNCTSDSVTPNYNEGNLDTQGVPGMINQILCVNPAWTEKQNCLPFVWTNIKFCQANNSIPYCDTKSFCGSCAGPCKSTIDTCVPDDSLKAKCQFDPSKALKGKWWESTWFIFSVSSLAILIVLIVMFVLISKSRNKK
jgi:hypothetical protein